MILMKSKTVKTDIIIPCYRQEATLPEALASVLTLPEVSACVRRVLILDDGSPGGKSIPVIVERAWREAGASIPYSVLHQRNKGLAATRNRLMEASETDWALPLDADDKLEPGGPAALCAAAETAGDKVGFIYGNYRGFAHKDGERYQVTQLAPVSFDAVIWSNQIPYCGLIRRSAWQQVKYDEEISRLGGFEDWLFLLELLAAGWEAQHVHVTVWNYRQYPGGSMQASALKRKDRLIRYMAQKLRFRWGAYMPVPC